MSTYQQITVATGANLGSPGPLPTQLVGLTDATLADLSAHLDAAQMADPTLAPFAGMGFVPAAPPPPPPPRVIARIDFIRRFTSAELAAIQGSADPLVKNFLFMLTVVSDVDLDNSDTQNGVGYLASQNLLAAGRPAVILA